MASLRIQFCHTALHTPSLSCGSLLSPILQKREAGSTLGRGCGESGQGYWSMGWGGGVGGGVDGEAFTKLCISSIYYKYTTAAQQPLTGTTTITVVFLMQGTGSQRTIVYSRYRTVQYPSL